MEEKTKLFVRISEETWNKLSDELSDAMKNLKHGTEHSLQDLEFIIKLYDFLNRENAYTNDEE